MRSWDLTDPATEGSPADLNALDLVFVPGSVRDSLVNWEEVAAAVLRRLRRQLARVGPEDPLHKSWDRIRSLPGVAALDLADDADRLPSILIPMRMREGDRILTWFSTLASFGAAGDVTLEELVIESFFPGDEDTRAFVSEMAAQAGAGPKPSRGTRRRGRQGASAPE